jgi:hypothetical protein
MQVEMSHQPFIELIAKHLAFSTEFSFHWFDETCKAHICASVRKPSWLPLAGLISKI